MMSYQLVDQIMKRLVENYPEDFIHLAFPDMEFQIITTALDKELIIKAGIKEGIEIGELKAYLELILQGLSDRFDGIDGETIETIKTIKDLNVLKLIYKKVSQVESLDVFKKILFTAVKGNFQKSSEDKA